MNQVNVDDAKSNLPALIDAAVNGEEILIAKDQTHVVKLVPVSQTDPRPRFGSAKGLISLAEDFDEPLEDLAIYSE
jgi:antitoxin (DNA-binding transcriptional repressor) of toxin-antitoxin stability system